MGLLINHKGKERTGLQETKKLPVGTESFEKIRTERFYYVVKRGF